MKNSMYFIAECGQGYAQSSTDLSISLAKWLALSAKKANADAVKFQLIIADELACQDYKYYGLFKSLELGLDGWRQIANYCESINLDLIFDVFGKQSIEAATLLGCNCIKIHPTDFNNLELLKKIATCNQIKTVIAGSGGSTFEEVKILCKALSNKKIVLMHGFQGYPTFNHANNLSRFLVLSTLSNDQSPNIFLGFADHSDPATPLATITSSVAVGLGVKYIEKHLTLARILELEDFESALSPDEFSDYVKHITAASEAFGSDTSTVGYSLCDNELKYRKMVARHVIAAKDISHGKTIVNSDLILKRSSCSEPITSLSSVIGKISNADIPANTPIQLHQISI